MSTHHASWFLCGIMSTHGASVLTRQVRIGFLSDSRRFVGFAPDSRRIRVESDANPTRIGQAHDIASGNGASAGDWYL